MATYVPGIQEYIPQFQPFQPDYNFLGNILQTKQSQYDSNYKQLSKKYGTLLNSDMLRADNIQKRNEFFKMIDQDIKKISGLDLSLEQNVDSANKVFDSFLQNKDMVYDMNFTREYQKQLGIAEQYRNCLDQTKCGGYYWEPGVNALHYKADEFKKANPQEAMSIQAGKYTPMINIQEAATSYLKDLLGKDGNSPFSVQSITYSKDGRYRITTTNGANLVMPYQQLLQAMYGKDQRIVDMYNTQAYVTRKNFVSQNAAKLGSEEAAEDKYFEILDKSYQEAQIAAAKARDLQNKARDKQKILAKEINERGSTGDDDLAKDYYGTAVDGAIANRLVDVHSNSEKVGKSFFDPSQTRAMRRVYADGLYSSNLMNREIDDAATRAAALTGSVKIEADEYAKSYYDHSLQMAEIASRANYEDRNNLRNANYQLNKDVAYYKFQKEYEKRGNAIGPSNAPRYVDAHPGTTATGEAKTTEEIQKEYQTNTTATQNAANNFSVGYANTLISIAGSNKASAPEQNLAKLTLQDIYGTAIKGKDGKYISAGYDPNTNTFVDTKGGTYNSADKIVGEYDYKKLYDSSRRLAEENRSVSTHASFTKGEGAKFAKDYDMYSSMEKNTSTTWRQNNKNVANYARTELDRSDMRDFGLLFDTDYNLKSKEDYMKSYIATIGGDADDAEDAYEDANEYYNKFYNSGNSSGKNADGEAVPLVISTQGSSMLGYFGGGKTAGGALMWDYNSDEPASLGTRGLLEFHDDANADVNSIWAIGTHDNLESAKDSQDEKGVNARLAFNTYINDIKTGNYTKEEKDLLLGQVLYMDVAGGDANKVGITVKLPAAFLQKYKGSDKKPKWADDMTLATEGVTIYMDRNKASNAFTQSVKAKPYDEILNFSPVTIDYPDGGSVTINPRSENGSYSVTGNVYYWKEVNGKMTQLPLPANKVYQGDVGGQNLFTALDRYMQEIDAANRIYRESNFKTNVFKNADELPDVKRYLDLAAGGDAPRGPMSIDDVNAMFIRGIEKSLFSGK